MRRVLLYLSILWIGVSGLANAQSDAVSWLMIDTAKQTLAVLQGNRVKQIFHNISVGRNGYTLDRHEGDGKTPLGVFHIAWINPNSRFHLFFGLDYPNQQYAEAALRHRLIDVDTYFDISKALYRGELPPQDTPLGGHIGIHGLGGGNRLIHETTNWTEGCIALTNEQIDQLAQWVTLGTRVVIY
jgi:murein L,D-transpeptidase YafK